MTTAERIVAVRTAVEGLADSIEEAAGAISTTLWIKAPIARRDALAAALDALSVPPSYEFTIHYSRGRLDLAVYC